MKKTEVEIGKQYVAKVSGRLTTVKITGVNRHGGWDAVNVESKKPVRIKSAQRLRYPVDRKHTKAIAEADQENARLREERAASPDSMTASERAMSSSGPTPTARRLKSCTKATRKPTETAIAIEPAAPAQAKKLSALDAAAQVLKASGQAMRTSEMISAMAEQGLWTSPGGKTPAATLYSAILREMATKGAQSRFRKIDAGKFEYAGA